ncbi:hypothetical protein [Hungatella hathewayi]|uniref:DUF3221 domain-containing protein n=1 Tax=Hungatella hathewayi TaxID=154046 RepID=A0A174BNR1_9FIRM|nr:hypothetical protein [Hungatella hathewayi]CUO02394.1 Uncharacterised protein [Hungatella hathewayi]
MNRKRLIIIGTVLAVIAIVVVLAITQSPKWSQLSFEAIVQETITQPDGEVRLIVERTTEIYGSPMNSLGISESTALIDKDGNPISIDVIQPGVTVKITLKNAFNEETPFYYPTIYEIKLIGN